MLNNMWVKVRTKDNKMSRRISGLNSDSKVEDVMSKLIFWFQPPLDHIVRLFYEGVQLEIGYKLSHYNVCLNHDAEVIVHQESSVSGEPVASDLSKPGSKPHVSPNKENKPPAKSPENSSQDIIKSRYYKIGALIDAKSQDCGAWFEAKIIDIKMSSDPVLQPGYEDDGLLYTVIFEDYEEEGPTVCKLKDFRPRAYRIVKFEDIEENSMVMVNYNVEEPKTRGYWYDGKITKKKMSRTSKELIATIFIGMEAVPLEGCRIPFPDEVIVIEKHAPIVPESEEASPEATISRRNITYCDVYGNNADLGLSIWCDDPGHIWSVSETEEWYCPTCTKDQVTAGEKLEASKKMLNTASCSSSSSSRNWGNGAGIGQTKECIVVSSWKCNIQYQKDFMAPPAKKNKRNRKHQESESQEVNVLSPNEHKRRKFGLPSYVGKLVKKKKVWNEDGFLKNAKGSFLCIVCQAVISKNVTTNCVHNVCKPCLEMCAKAKVVMEREEME